MRTVMPVDCQDSHHLECVQVLVFMSLCICVCEGVCVCVCVCVYRCSLHENVWAVNNAFHSVVSPGYQLLVAVHQKQVESWFTLCVRDLVLRHQWDSVCVCVSEWLSRVCLNKWAWIHALSYYYCCSRFYIIVCVSTCRKYVEGWWRVLFA